MIASVSADLQQDLVIHILHTKEMLGLHLISASAALQDRD